MENVESKFNTASMENESLNGAGEFHIFRGKCILELFQTRLISKRTEAVGWGEGERKPVQKARQHKI